MLTNVKKVGLIVAIAATTAIASPAMAQEAGSLSSGAVSSIQSVGADILAVGGAIIALAATSLGVRWVKAQFF